MTGVKRWIAALGAVAAVAVLLAACGSSGSSSSSSSAKSSSSASGTPATKKPILIGAAIDETALMAPTDDPALFGAQLEVKKINAAGGVDGRPLAFAVQNDQLKPDQTRADALSLVSKGANVLWVTCDVDFSTPSIQVGLSAKLLTIAPCIGTDQMGPKRFGSAGALAFSYGNVAQDEGAADARIAIKQGWKTANVVIDKQIVYSQNVCAAFANKFKSLGGKVVSTQTWTQGDHTIGNVANRVNASKAAVMEVCTTAAPDVSTFLSDVRSAGNQTPFLAPWSLDGTYWLPKSPKIATNVWTDSYASIYGDDPNPEVRALIKQLTAEGHAPTTGGFVTGAAAIDGIVAAIKASGGSTDGAKLAAAMQAFKALPTLSGAVTFSPQLHTVFGREYRVLEVTGGKGHFKYLIKAGGLAQL
ncbi:MAG TPA: ABC transporter substrate-binding protein [Solirubrobacteraceae bacterium]|jgi:branched-chain amino acid transport system substrate-binding protein